MSDPLTRGSMFAMAAAILFGATTPFLKWFGAGAGPFATAALLYAGAMMGAGWPTRRSNEPQLLRGHFFRVALVAFFGATVAPVCLAWGVQHVDAARASLLLNLEAVFTVLLALALYREPVGRRVGAAALLMVLGGSLLAIRTGAIAGSSALGILAVVLATLSWAMDNALTRPLADRDPRAVVFWKALMGAALSAIVAWTVHDRWPAPRSTAGLLLCGAVGYGLSLRFYLHAQRRVGAARTGSLFALAPFIGTTIALTTGTESFTLPMMAAACLFAIATYLHVTEKHGHVHRHDALEHEHAHRHDDGHHLHTHPRTENGEGVVHSHWHRHDETRHDHRHGVDLHHHHEHE